MQNDMVKKMYNDIVAAGYSIGVVAFSMGLWRAYIRKEVTGIYRDRYGYAGLRRDIAMVTRVKHTHKCKYVHIYAQYIYIFMYLSLSPVPLPVIHTLSS